MEIENMKPDLEDLSESSPLWLRVGVVAFLLIAGFLTWVRESINSYRVFDEDDYF